MLRVSNGGGRVRARLASKIKCHDRTGDKSRVANVRLRSVVLFVCSSSFLSRFLFSSSFYLKNLNQLQGSVPSFFAWARHTANQSCLPISHQSYLWLWERKCFQLCDRVFIPKTGSSNPAAMTLGLINNFFSSSILLFNTSLRAPVLNYRCYVP